jgi:hypothetical protein
VLDARVWTDFNSVLTQRCCDVDPRSEQFSRASGSFLANSLTT